MAEYRLSKQETIEACKEILEEYSGAVTLRQLYYQIVARDLETNSDKVYKRLGSIIAEARRSGEISYEALEDRGRLFRQADAESDPRRLGGEALLQRVQDWVQSIPRMATRMSRWSEQPVHLSVWVEKEALASVVERAAEGMGFGWTACKGYPSMSLLYSYMQSVVEYYSSWSWEALERAADTGDMLQPVILYLGDHDPDGIAIPKAVSASLDEMWESFIERRYDEEGLLLSVIQSPRLQRIALTREQIRHYAPPPFPAKESSSRFRSYVESTGLTEAWELDALRPDVLNSLIRTEAEKHFRQDIYDAGAERAQSAASAIREHIDSIMRGEVDASILPMLPPHGAEYDIT